MTRRHDLDWVRVCAFGLLILYHVGMYYVTWDWHVKSPFAGHAAEPLMVLSAPWRLSLLFLVSGAATAFMLAKGEPRFLAGRSWRLLVPLLFGMLVIVAPQSYYQVVEKGFGGSFSEFYALYLKGGLCRDGKCLQTPTWNHLWFVAYLWVYTALLALLLRLAPAAVERTCAGVRRALSGSGLILWPALFFIVARMLLVMRFESTHNLKWDWYNHAQYFTVFLLGYALAQADAVWEAIERQRWIALAIAAAAGAYLAGYVAAFTDHDPPYTLRVVARTAWGLTQWCAIVAVLGFARRFKPGDSPALRYLALAVFPVYIVHQTLIVVFAHNLQPLRLSPVLEAPLLIAMTAAGCLAAYEIVRRVRWLRPLFGLKAMEAAAATSTQPVRS